MAKLIAARGAQWTLVSEFTWSPTDTVTDTSGAAKDFAAVGTTVFDAINLPVGAIISGGEVVTETAVSGATAYNVSVGDSGSATRYLGVTDKVAAGRTALVPTGYVGTGENLRITVSPTVATATTGKVTVRIHYVIRNRTNEVITV